MKGTRVCHWQSAQRLWPDSWRLQLPLDDCCRLMLPYHALKHATDGTDPRDPDRMGAKVLLLAIIPVPQKRACSHTHPIGHTPIILVIYPSYWSHTYPTYHTPILLVTHPSHRLHTPILLITHPSSWSHIHIPGHTR